MSTPPFSWIQNLPKVCLHDHLDGGLQPATIIEIAEQIGHELPATDPAVLEQWFLDACDSGSLVRYLETFSHTTAVMQRGEDLSRVAFEHVLTLAGDGVIYGEVRWAPELHTRKGLSLQEAVDAVGAGLMKGMQYVAERGGRILVNQIVCAMRQENRSLEIVQLALANRDRGVVGFDLAGPEEGFLASMHQQALDYAAEHFMPVTLHAGEAAGLDSLHDAVVQGRALRLGHGVRITEDFTFSTLAELDPNEQMVTGGDRSQEILQLGPLASWIKDRRITLEVCPCSNLHTDAANMSEKVGKGAEFSPAKTYGDHPVALMFSAGLAVAISPDNRLMSQTSMTREFTELATNFGFGAAEFFELTINAIEGAFISLDEKQVLMRSIQGPYAKAMAEDSAE